MASNFEWRKVSGDTIGIAPTWFKSLVLFMIYGVIMVLGYLLLWQEEITLHEEAIAAEDGIRAEFIDKSKKAANLDVYKQQMVDIEKNLGDMLKQLPSKTEMDGLLSDINNAGTNAGLTFTLFRPGSESAAGFYVERPIQIEMKGTYHQLGAFAENIAHLPRIVTLADLTMKPANQPTEKFSGTILITANAKTFRYMDSAEYAAAEKERNEKEKMSRNGTTVVVGGQ